MEPADLVRPGQARRLAEAREASGREIAELASLLGISFPAFRDLEDFDEEMVDCVSLGQLITLSEAIGLDLRGFFEADKVGHATFGELAEKLQSLVAGGSLDDLEEEVGWELQGHLDDPSTFGELPAIALADIGEPVGVDWRSFLPR
jgi:hypothetical protein